MTTLITRFGRDAVRSPRATIPAETATWTVLQVKSRQEKALAGDLRALDIQHYLPMVRRSQVYAGRRFNVELPLFPGYLFLSGTLDEVYMADRTRRVAKIINVYDQKQLDWELTNLRIALEGSATLDPYPFLKKGVRVEVRSGPFRGLEGLIEDRAGATRLILQIAMLGRAVGLEIDGSQLEVIEPAA
jgi:transcription antitermination factor NusG